MKRHADEEVANERVLVRGSLGPTDLWENPTPISPIQFPEDEGWFTPSHDFPNFDFESFQFDEFPFTFLDPLTPGTNWPGTVFERVYTSSNDGTLSGSSLLSPSGTNQPESTDDCQTTLEVHDETACTIVVDPELVHFGTVVGIRCQPNKSASLTESDLNNEWRNHVTDLNRVKLLVDEEHVGLASYQGAAFGRLNNLAAQALRHVGAIPGADLQAYVPCDRLSAFRKDAPLSDRRRNQCFDCEVVICGLRKHKFEVGDILSRHNMFLQEATLELHDIPYENPHIWEMPDLSENDRILDEPVLGTIKSPTSPSNGTYSRVLDDLSCGLLDEVQHGPTQLTTELLTHQNQALNFMVRRETGDIDAAARYWQYVVGADGIQAYKHTVTGVECSYPPQESKGGLLADGMGLGKTLTSVALITSSLERAQTFASSFTAVRDRRHSGCTLIVVPSILIMDQWENEIRTRVRSGVLRVTRYHGHDRVMRSDDLLDFDIVLTTFGTVATEYRNRRRREVLYHLHWFRIILDEAHTIRSLKTKQCEAVLELSAQHRWCLSGTPISNRVQDLEPLFRFCQVPLLDEHTIFQEQVTKVTRQSFLRGCRVLRQTLQPICLRRRKEILRLPEAQYETIRVDFSQIERGCYDKLLKKSRIALSTRAGIQKVHTKPHNIFQMLLQLRILCNMGTFMQTIRGQDASWGMDPDEILTLLQEEGLAHCASCLVEIPVLNQRKDCHSGLLPTCAHMLCAACLGETGQRQGSPELYECPVCQQSVKQQAFSFHETALSAGDNHRYHSTKIEKLMENLNQTRNKEKSIVFSVWKRTLDVVALRCQAEGMRYVRIDGTVPQPQRQEALRSFISDPQVAVLLMTLGTGGLGLNVIAARRIHILEPQWNPSVESQAVGRVVRLGQADQVTVIRYIVDKTVEQQVQKYQERKLRLADGSFDTGISKEVEAKLITDTFFST
ncbi:SNF2 family N-terminal domain-containing protein 3 [Elsinoe fawcettii]|nr:SNF2 family N-terminal domain-containing protein 3 [Elsinoe fawcettii]